ncbi:MAG: transglutaminase-like domain-containing protein [Acutalibacter sp.]
MPNSKKEGIPSSPLLDRPRILFAEPKLLSQCLFYGVLLLLGSAGALGCFFGTFQVPLAPLPVILAGAVSLLFTLGLFLGKKPLWIPTLLGLMLWVILVWRFFEQVLQGCAQTLNLVLAAYEDKLGVPLPYLEVQQGLTSQEIRTQCTWFCCLLIFPFLFFLGWLLVGRKSSLGAFCLSGFFVAVPLVISLVPPTPWLALLLLFWAVLLLFSPSFGKRHRLVEDRGRFYASGSGLARPAMLLLFVCAGVLSMAVVSWLVPYSTYQRPQVATDIQEGFRNGFGLDAALQGGVGSGNSRVNLNSLGSRSYTGKTMLRVRYQWETDVNTGNLSSNQHKDYLKSFVGSVYTGTSWERLSGQDWEELSKLLQGEKPQLLTDRLRTVFWQELNTSYHLEVENVGANPRCIYVPYGLMGNSVDTSQMAYVEDGFLRSNQFFSGTSRYALDAWGLADSYYQAENYPSRVQPAIIQGYAASQGATFADYINHADIPGIDGIVEELFRSLSGDLNLWTIPEDLRQYLTSEQQELSKTTEAYTQFVYEHYTQLPQDLKATLDQYLADHQIHGSGQALEGNSLNYSPTQLAQQVANTLAATCTYTLSPPALPEGRDFVEYFLLESRQGYCVHFATAAVALLRAMGIPARYAEGYAVPSGEEGWVEVPDYNAHAWVEIYLSGNGWTPVEVTPAGPDAPAATEDARPMETQTATATPSPTPSPSPSPTPAPDQEASPSPSQVPESSAAPAPGGTVSQEEHSFPWEWVTVGCTLGGLLLAAGVFLLRRQVVLRLRAHRLAQEAPNQAALLLYKEILELYRAAEHFLPGWEETPPEQLESLALKARFSQHTLTPQELEAFQKELDRMTALLQTQLPLSRRLWLALGPVLL